MLRLLIGEDVRSATLLQPRISHVRADLGQLNQGILNLVVNARDAMPQGGSLTLETREIDLDVAEAKTHLYVRPSRYVLLTVRDTGWGMPADVQAYYFEPFFTNKAEGQGTGTGAFGGARHHPMNAACLRHLGDRSSPSATTVQCTSLTSTRSSKKSHQSRASGPLDA
jgi:hypothetical protein